MFTMPAIHHSAVKVEDESLGTMHLNALNGSSNVLNYSDSDNNNCLGHSGVFGGLIGVSLSENHPYRPQDCGMTFHDTLKYSHRKPIETTSSIASSISSSFCKSCNFQWHCSKHRDVVASSRSTTLKHVSGTRRRSLDLDLISSNTHQRYRDRSMSLDELVIGPFSRLTLFPDDAIEELEQPSEPDTSGLTLTEVSMNTYYNHDFCHITTDSAKKKKKKTRFHSTDSCVSERALRLLEKIKDSRKDHNSNFKHSHKTKEDNHQNITTSRNDIFGHNVLHLLFTSEQQPQELHDL